MTKSHVKTYRASAALSEAMEKYCALHGVDESEWVRSLIAEAVGQPGLAEMPMGRPKGVAKKAAAKSITRTKSE